MLGPYIKSRGTRAPKCQQMQTSSQWRHMYNKGNNLKTRFSFMGQNVKKMYILGYYWDPEGVFNDQTGPILLSAILSPYLCTCEIRKQKITESFSYLDHNKKKMHFCYSGPIIIGSVPSCFPAILSSDKDFLSYRVKIKCPADAA